MKICPKCGASNDDSSNFCIACGTRLPKKMPEKSTANESVLSANHSSDLSTLSKKPRKRTKTLWIVLGAIAAALIVSLVLLFTLSPKIVLARAGWSTIKLFSKAIEDNTDLPISSSKVIQAISQGEISGELEFSGDAYSVKADFDYSKQNDALAGDAQFEVDEYNIGLNLDYSVGNGIFKVRIPDLSDDVYGLNMEDYLGTAVGDLPPAVKALGVFSADIGTEEAIAFIRSAKVEKVSNSSIHTEKGKQECRVYKISWDEDSDAKFTKLLEKSGKASANATAISAELAGLDLKLKCFVKGGKILRFDILYEDEQYSLVLKGDDNPWNNLTIAWENASGTEQTCSIKSDLEDDTLQVTFANEDTYTAVLFYDVETDKYRLHDEKGNYDVFSGRFELNGTELIFTIDDFNETGISAYLTIVEQESMPEAISGSYTDIKEVDWENLMLQMLLSNYG